MVSILCAYCGSQELLEAVERERRIRITPPRNATIFHHPTLGDFELQHVRFLSSVRILFYFNRETTFTPPPPLSLSLTTNKFAIVSIFAMYPQSTTEVAMFLFAIQNDKNTSDKDKEKNNKKGKFRKNLLFFNFIFPF